MDAVIKSVQENIAIVGGVSLAIIIPQVGISVHKILSKLMFCVMVSHDFNHQLVIVWNRHERVLGLKAGSELQSSPKDRPKTAILIILPLNLGL